MSSTLLVFDSQPNFRSNSNKFQFTECCLQSRLNRCHCQIFLFRGDAAGLSVAIRYRASKHYAPTHNLISTIESPLWWFLEVITLPSKNLNQIIFRADFFSLRMLRASRSKTWVIYRLIKSSQGCFWYRAFLLNPLKFDGIASSHFCVALYHMHHLTSVFITLSKSVSIWCNLECILYSLVVMECFHWPLLDCYSLNSTILPKLYLELHPLDLPCASHALLAIM
jgi:hypothetical protein